MGVIISAISIVSNSIKKARDKRKAKKTNTAALVGGRQAQDPSQQPQLVPEQLQAEAALQVEHLATSPPIYESSSQLSNAGRIGGQELKGGEATATTPAKPSHDKNQSKMASDEDYAAFLDKANEDPSAGSKAQTQSSNGKLQLKAVDGGVQVPEVLQKVEAYYVSDADEEFVPVCLKLTGKGLPDEKTFAKLVHHPSPGDAEVQILDIGEWDPRGQYKEVVDAVREAAKGSDVRVYRIANGGSRFEYWVVSVEAGRLLGVKALAVES